MWLVLFLALAGVRADKFAATTGWKLQGPTNTTTIPVQCDPAYTQAVIMGKGANATMQFSGFKWNIDGIMGPAGGVFHAFMDNNAQLEYGCNAATDTCETFSGQFTEDDNQHILNVLVPADQDGDVTFIFLGADITADGGLITDPGTPTSPSTTPPASTTPPSSTTPGTTSTTSSHSTSAQQTSPSGGGSKGLATGALVAIALVIPIVAAILIVIGFWFWRRRRQQRLAQPQEGEPKPYNVQQSSTSPGGGTGSTPFTADTKSSAFFGRRPGVVDMKEPIPYILPPASASASPAGTSTGNLHASSSSGSPRSRNANASSSTDSPRSRHRDAPSSGSTPNSSSQHRRLPQLPPGAAAPAGAPVAGGPPEPAMADLYHAMNQAGFTVHTLFDRLRREDTTRSGRRRGGGATTVAETEILPRYD